MRSAKLDVKEIQSLNSLYIRGIDFLLVRLTFQILIHLYKELDAYHISSELPGIVYWYFLGFYLQSNNVLVNYCSGIFNGRGYPQPPNN